MNDIDAINAAIRLGDRVIPPVGSRIMATSSKWLHGTPFFICGDSSYILEDQLRIDGAPDWAVLSVVSGGSDSVIAAIWGFIEVMVVISIPEDAPSFEKWGRL